MMKNLLAPALIVASVAACGPKKGGNNVTSAKADSLVTVIEGRKDDFPATHRATVPLSGRNSLGSTVDETGERRITPRYNNCFFVVPQKVKGVERIAQTITGSAGAKAEFSAVAASLGGTMESEDEVTVAFDGISVYGGYGVPDLTAPCGTLENGSTIDVVTEQIKAETASINFSQSFRNRIGASGGVKKVSGEVSAGWAGKSEGEVLGTDIVLTSRVDSVTITVEDGPQQPIPDAVKPGTAFKLPKAVADVGDLVVNRIDVPANTVSINFQPKLGANQEVDPKSASGLPENRCAIGQDQAVAIGKSCVFWLAPGNAALAVGVKREDDKVQLWSKYYRTTMVPSQVNVAGK